MVVQQFIKRLNNTELGKASTHEYYVLVPKAIQYFFNDSNSSFFDCISGAKLDGVHISNIREFRVNGLGNYYRSNNVNAGDEIIFQKNDDGVDVSFSVNLKTNEDLVTLQRIGQRGFEILNFGNLKSSQIGDSYEVKAAYKGTLSKVEIKLESVEKKRSDSPEKTSFYNILVNGKDVKDDFNGSGFFVNLKGSGDKRILCKSDVWQKYEFNY